MLLDNLSKEVSVVVYNVTPLAQEDLLTIIILIYSSSSTCTRGFVNYHNPNLFFQGTFRTMINNLASLASYCGSTSVLYPYTML